VAHKASPNFATKNERDMTKEDLMKRLLTFTAMAVLMGLTPALAATKAPLPAQPGVSPNASKQATMPNQGSTDKSGGAAEQSSAPPASSSVKSSEGTMPEQGVDQSKGAKEQSSAPPDSTASESKPDPNLQSNK
jgi:hypothetical protein